jgi:hypothetical protein
MSINCFVEKSCDLGGVNGFVDRLYQNSFCQSASETDKSIMVAGCEGEISDEINCHRLPWLFGDGQRVKEAMWVCRGSMFAGLAGGALCDISAHC